MNRRRQPEHRLGVRRWTRTRCLAARGKPDPRQAGLRPGAGAPTPPAAYSTPLGLTQKLLAGWYSRQWPVTSLRDPIGSFPNGRLESARATPQTAVRESAAAMVSVRRITSSPFPPRRGLIPPRPGRRRSSVARPGGRHDELRATFRG